MKIKLFSLFLVLACPGFLAMSSAAQTFTTLYSFTATYYNGSAYGSNIDGATPDAKFILSGNTLYGAAGFGGRSGYGTLFAINTDGTGFTTLYNFPFEDNPSGQLALSGATLYGTAGGTSGGNAGTVYKINTDGTGFTTLHSFNGGTEGRDPAGGVVLAGDILYGAAVNYGGVYTNGSSGNGTVFAVKVDGTGFTNLYNLTHLANSTNSDGASPYGGLVLSGNTLYGTAYSGGSSGAGTVFAVNTNGAGFTTLHNFNSIDGARPGVARLLLSGNTLYGTAANGGSSGNGTIFAVNTDGTGFTILHSFTAGTGSYPGITNSDGVGPNAGLILAGNTLYGTAYYGGSSANGTVFAVNTDGTGFTTLHSFRPTLYSSVLATWTNSDGANPSAELVFTNNTLYGSAAQGGSSGRGTVFALNLAPTLGILWSGNQVILSWPAAPPSFGLQSTTNMASPAVWNATFPEPVVINGQNVVTNSIAGTQQYYRLCLNSSLSNGLAFIPAGSFQMGDALGDGNSDELPAHTVNVSAFYMDVNLVSYSQWQAVYSWATNHGYGFANAGAGKAANHPVQMVDWYDTVKWCNARSQQAGLTPVYYTDAGFTQIYTNGEVTVYANWTAKGYRLPTEAEWEKAARGALSGVRFPWGNTISWSQANYSGYPSLYTYDHATGNGNDPVYNDSVNPYTSPVGSFAANGYGVYDMAGNVYEWCWDWYDSGYYSVSPGTDPLGPASSPSGTRVQHGGSWNSNAIYCRPAFRNGFRGPASESNALGFRSVLPAGQ